MIYYSIMPEGYDALEWDTGTLKEIELDGIRMVVRVEKDEATLVRLLSPELMDYLDPRFEPGTKLDMLPKIKN